MLGKRRIEIPTSDILVLDTRHSRARHSRARDPLTRDPRARRPHAVFAAFAADELEMLRRLNVSVCSPSDGLGVKQFRVTRRAENEVAGGTRRGRHSQVLWSSLAGFLGHRTLRTHLSSAENREAGRPSPAAVKVESVQRHRATSRAGLIHENSESCKEGRANDEGRNEEGDKDHACETVAVTTSGSPAGIESVPSFKRVLSNLELVLMEGDLRAWWIRASGGPGESLGPPRRLAPSDIKFVVGTETPPPDSPRWSVKRQLCGRGSGVGDRAHL
ncbi:hypothetical protein FB45DRAFT_858692 [Roridomyces roridus]|uniref:Uncharacterized protein n=1 Tax=Roridomyces roridus TaxID=1738132 RepID=A0AAD7CI10_9AGAR|nr:hypothetical protein FB45DRAFT_858692 [Roridomyces roridus]